jgi:hypothetical protein
MASSRAVGSDSKSIIMRSTYFSKDDEDLSADEDISKTASSRER